MEYNGAKLFSGNKNVQENRCTDHRCRHLRLLCSARAFSRYTIDTTVIEKEADVCTGISKANTGIIYQGYDQHPGSLKADLCRKASVSSALCKELDVNYKKRGLLMLSFGPNADRVLEKRFGMQKFLIYRMYILSERKSYTVLEPSLQKKVLYLRSMQRIPCG